MTNLEEIIWRRINLERQERILLTARVTLLEQRDQRPSVLIEAPRTLLDWYELIRSIEKLIIWLVPRFLLPAWGAVQSLWPWLRDVAIPWLRTLLG